MFVVTAFVTVGGLGETIRIATYNIENYGVADRMTEDGFRKEYPKPEREKEALRTVICGLNADVLVLQEVGDRDYLEELRKDLRSVGVDYPVAYVLEGADSDRHIALLSRRAFKRLVPYTAVEFSYFGAKERVKRGLVAATIATAAGDVTLFGLHLKSRYTDRADDPMSTARRLGEATAVRNAVLAQFPQPAAERFLILGDCNDGRTSKTIQRLQRRGHTEISRLLPAEDSRGEAWTHNYRKEETYTRVDHVLISAALRDAVRGGVAKIYDGPGVVQASDHRPVVVTLDL